MLKSQSPSRLLNPKLFACIITGFSSGLPMYFMLNLLQAWLAKNQVDVKTLGLFALTQLPYTWKFLWAPLMDRYSPPLGRRRGWMVITQIILLGLMALFGQINPQDNLGWVSLLALTVAFFGASQDVVLDAYRREMLGDNEQEAGTSMHVAAYRVASLVPGSLSLILADYMPWPAVFLITSLFMTPGLCLALMATEPASTRQAPKSLQEAVVEPFHEFLNRQGVRQTLLILGFMVLYKLGDSMATSLATKFYLDIGFKLKEIGLVAKNAGLWPAVAGGLVGAVWMMRMGLTRSLWVFGIIQTVVIAGFAVLTFFPKDLLALGLVIGIESFGTSLGTAAFTTYIAKNTNPAYTATQFALFTSLAALPRTLLNSSSGWLVATLGWCNYFYFCMVLAIPGLIVLYYIKHEDPAQASAKSTTNGA